MSKRIELTHGKFAVVDDADYPLVSMFNWHWSPGGYAATSVKSCEGGYSLLSMHRLLVNPPEGLVVDHVSGDRLDNRRCNLRIATTAQNVRNARRSAANTSGFKGVCWDRERSKWLARVRVDRKWIHLGRYDNPVIAALAYDRAATEHHGEFARLNFNRESRSDGDVLKPHSATLIYLLGI